MDTETYSNVGISVRAEKKLISLEGFRKMPIPSRLSHAVCYHIAQFADCRLQDAVVRLGNHGDEAVNAITWSRTDSRARWYLVVDYRMGEVVDAALSRLVEEGCPLWPIVLVISDLFTNAKPGSTHIPG